MLGTIEAQVIVVAAFLVSLTTKENAVLKKFSGPGDHVGGA